MMSQTFIALALLMIASSQAYRVKRADSEVSACKGVPVEIGLVLDSSSSIWKQHFELAKTFLQDVVSLFDIGPDKARVSLILYGRGIYTDQAFDLDAYSTKEALVEALGNVKHKNGDWTSTGAGIDYMRDHQLSVDKVRPGITRIGVVITDGNSQESQATAEAAAASVQAGIEMIAIGVGRGVKDEELLKIAGGNASRVIRANKFTELKDILEPLQDKICQPIPTLAPTTPPPQTSSCSLDLADVYFVFSQSALGLEHTSWTSRFISTLIATDELESGYRYGVISDVCDGGFDIGSINRIDTIQNRLLGYEEFKLPGLVQKLVEKGYPTGCGEPGKVAVLFSAAGQKAVVGMQAQVDALVDQGVQVFLVDLSGQGVQVAGATTLTGASPSVVAGELVSLLCVE